MMAKATCNGTKNSFNNNTIPCGWGVEGLSNEGVRELGKEHLRRYGLHNVAFELDGDA